MKKIVFKIDGMKCGMCEAHINDVIRKNVEIKKVSSSHKKGETIVLLDDENKIFEMIEIIQKQGYRVLYYEIFDYEK